MSWSVIHAPSAAAEGAAVADRLGAAGRMHIEGAGSGIVFVGDDHALAAYAWESGSRTPILHVPVGPSDLARMFGSDLRGVEDRLASGGPYPADLGFAESEEGAHAFVAHAVASRSGRIPGWAARRATVDLTVGERAARHRASGVVLVNAQHVAGRAVAPRSAIMDGRAEVQVLGGAMRDRSTVLRRMRRGLHLRHPGVFRRSFESARLELPAEWIFAVDGHPVPGRRWEVTIHAGSLTLWV